MLSKSKQKNEREKKMKQNEIWQGDENWEQQTYIYVYVYIRVYIYCLFVLRANRSISLSHISDGKLIVADSLCSLAFDIFLWISNEIEKRFCIYFLYICINYWFVGENAIKDIIGSRSVNMIIIIWLLIALLSTICSFCHHPQLKPHLSPLCLFYSPPPTTYECDVLFLSYFYHIYKLSCRQRYCNTSLATSGVPLCQLCRLRHCIIFKYIGYIVYVVSKCKIYPRSQCIYFFFIYILSHRWFNLFLRNSLFIVLVEQVL